MADPVSTAGAPISDNARWLEQRLSQQYPGLHPHDAINLLISQVDELRLLRAWEPRPYQQKLWNYLLGGGRRACAIWHRRSGKDSVALNWAAECAITQVAEYWHMLPEAAQGRKVIWDAVNPHTGRKRIDESFPTQFRAATRDNDMSIRFINGSLWRVVGSDNYESLLGSTPAGVVFSEWALADPNAWAFLRPILAENKGWAIFITTPRGPNHARTTFDLSQQEPGWFGEVLTVKDTNVFTTEQLETELRELQHEYGHEEGLALYSQEYECSFNTALLGSYYGACLARAERDHRIGNVPIDRGVLVHTAWDLGVSDSTSIWFIQCVGKERRLIDYHEGSGVGLDDYARVLDAKQREQQWVYGLHYFPHDIEQRELGNRGLSRVDTLRSLGIKATVVPLHNRNDGINATRRLLDQAWIDEKRCERGLNALRNYRREWDEKLKMFRDAPLHDWACVTGDTMVLTRCGAHPIKDIPPQGSVLTSCGWKPYRNPRVTRKNAPLVEVRFVDGLTVKCTEEHLFLTDSGWKFAGHLRKGLVIQSSLTFLRSIGMAACTACGRMRDIILAAVGACIPTFGRPYLVPFPAGATSITETTIISTTELRILNACQWASTYRSLGIEVLKGDANIHSHPLPEKGPPSGTNQKQAGYGIRAMQRGQKIGKNGSEKIGHVLNAVSRLIALFGRMVISRSFAVRRASPLIIESIRSLHQREDVWCLTVDDGACWSLANGAITHNSHGADALRTFAAGFRDPKERKPVHQLPRFRDDPRPADRGTGWMGR